MTKLISQKALFGVDPTEGFVQYTQAIKPYHTKILEVLVEYVYQEIVQVEVVEHWNWKIDATRPDIEVISSCGYGTIWDSPFVVNEYPIVKIKQAIGDTPIGVSCFSDPIFPTHVIISYNPDNYVVSVGDPITFRTTETLPHTTLGPISPGKVYYIVSLSNNIIEISTTLLGTPLAFISSGTGIINIHQEHLKYNSFLVEPEIPKLFQCIAINTVSNQLVFVNNYNIIGVNPLLKQWVVNELLLTSAYQDVISAPIALGSTTGLLDDITIYTASIFLDNIEYPISIIGNTAQTYSDLITHLNTILGPNIVTLIDNHLRITSPTVGYLSSVNILDIDLFSSLLSFDTFTEQVNETLAIPGNKIYIKDNGGSGTNGTYTIESVIISSNHTLITTQEPISILAQINGTLNLQDDIKDIPNWVSGTAVKVSSPYILPYPLIAGQIYYFIPSDSVGYFNLSIKQIPTSVLDIVDLSNLGENYLNIERAELFYPGAVVKVAGTYLSRNDGDYYVRNVKKEDSYLRVDVLQKVNKTSPSFLPIDGTMSLVLGYGYDFPNFCTPLQSPDLYTDTYIDERITFEFVVNLNDQIVGQFFEDDTSELDILTTIGPIAYTILPTGFDAQFFDLGVIDEDNHYNNYNLGNTL